MTTVTSDRAPGSARDQKRIPVSQIPGPLLKIPSRRTEILAVLDPVMMSVLSAVMDTGKVVAIAYHATRTARPALLPVTVLVAITELAQTRIAKSPAQFQLG